MELAATPGLANGINVGMTEVPLRQATPFVSPGPEVPLHTLVRTPGQSQMPMHSSFAIEPSALVSSTTPHVSSALATASLVGVMYRSSLVLLLLFLVYVVYALIQGGPSNPVANLFGSAVRATREAIRAPAVGLVAAEELAADTADSALSFLERKIDGGANDISDPPLDSLLANLDRSADPSPHSDTEVWNKSNPKSGYCYIGEEKGFRACAYVADSNNCMSGKVFERDDLCKNPTLRA